MTPTTRRMACVDICLPDVDIAKADLDALGGSQHPEYKLLHHVLEVRGGVNLRPGHCST